MNKVKPAFECTVKLLELLENGAEANRDDKIKEINNYLEKRQMVMNELVPPYSDQEMELGIQLVELNKTLTLLLEREKSAILDDLKTVIAKKKIKHKIYKPI